jgi:RimJ/RimL family protein N-acetyltransferase
MLNGRKITLRAWHDGDVPFFQDLRNDLATQISLMAEPHPHTMADARRWLESRTSAKDGVFFVIATHPENDVCGFVELRAMHTAQRYAYLGICLAPPARGHGYAAEALNLLEGYARDGLLLRKLVLNVLASHDRAVQLYERAGYRRVGVHLRHFRYGNSFHDVLIMEKSLEDNQQNSVPPWTL